MKSPQQTIAEHFDAKTIYSDYKKMLTVDDNALEAMIKAGQIGK